LKTSFTLTTASSQASASTPRLLPLPPEIRNTIWTHIVGGGNAVHVYRDGKAPGSSGPLKHAICITESPDAAAIAKIRARGVRERIKVDSFQKPHNECPGQSATAAGAQTSQPHALIYTCRQIHNETARLYYSSNTFSFSHHTVFNDFLARLAPDARDALRTIVLAKSA